MHLSFAQSFRWAYLLPYFLLLIVGLSVPSDGGHGLFSIKSLSFLSASFALFLHCLIKQTFPLSQAKMLPFLIFTIVFLLAWLFVGFGNEEQRSSAIDQFKIFIITVAFVVMSVYLINLKLLSFQTLLKTAILTNFAYGCFKITLIILHFLGFINIFSMAERVGTRLISMAIIGPLFRFQLSIDIVTPFLLFMFLQSKHFGINWGKNFKKFYLVITVLSVMLSFSRFLLGAAGVAICLHVWTLGISHTVRFILWLIALFFAVVLVFGPENVYKVFEQRFLSEENTVSDSARHEQIQALLEEHEQHVFLGKGLGGYAPAMLRDLTILHSYEVQWVAFLMQFGLVGLTLLLLPLVIIAGNILSYPWTQEKLALFTMFLIWLFSGFTNPFLISLASGIMYTLFYLAGRELARKKPLLEQS